MKLSYTGGVNYLQPLRKITWQLLEMIKIYLSYDPDISLVDFTKKNVSMCSHKDLYMNVHSFIHNSHKQSKCSTISE